jgi:hypothetical protein
MASATVTNAELLITPETSRARKLSEMKEIGEAVDRLISYEGISPTRRDWLVRVVTHLKHAVENEGNKCHSDITLSDILAKQLKQPVAHRFVGLCRRALNIPASKFRKANGNT